MGQSHGKENHHSQQNTVAKQRNIENDERMHVNNLDNNNNNTNNNGNKTPPITPSNRGNSFNIKEDASSTRENKKNVNNEIQQELVSVAEADEETTATDNFNHWQKEDHNRMGMPKSNNKVEPLQRTLHATMKKTTMNKHDLKTLVKLPPNADYNEWLALNSIHFYKTCLMISQNYCYFCTPESCPSMTAGVVEYLWKDNNKYITPTSIPACQYIEFALNEALHTIDNPEVFPIHENEPFPKIFLPKVKEMFKRFFRQFAHIYYSHYEQLKIAGSAKHLNNSFKHFIIFVMEFNLIDSTNLMPLQSFIEHIIGPQNTRIHS